MKKSLFLGLIALIAVACKGDDPAVVPPPGPGPGPGGTEEPEEVVFTSFKFRPAVNDGLTAEVSCKIDGNEITGLLPSLKSGEGLVASFTGNFTKVEIDGKEQSSGSTRVNFNDVVTYKLSDDEGNTSEYKVTVKTFTGLPIVTLTTDGYNQYVFNNQPVPGNMEEVWVDGSVAISKTPDFASGYKGTGRIRGRGNATWLSYPKQPFRFKLDGKSQILGMPADKDWVLLAEYTDKSLLRVTYGNELSRLTGLPWSPRGHHVEFFMANSAGEERYMGTYYLTEHVKDGPDRADVVDGGFLIERDNYWNQEPVYFTSNRGFSYTFKFPDSDDLTNGDPTVTAVKIHIDEFESVLYGENFMDPANGYRKYIDPVNFAQWMLIQEALANMDTNPFLVRASSSSKMQMYPIWDVEWSLGLGAPGPNGWAQPPTVPPVDMTYWMNNGYYFGRLMEDPYFRGIVKTEWTKIRNNHIPALKERIREEADVIKYAQAENFKRWDILGKWGIGVNLVVFDTWEEEVDYAADFFDRRVAWLDGVVRGL